MFSIIQYCHDYLDILGNLNDRENLIIQEEQEFINSEQKRTKFSDPFLAFMQASVTLKWQEVIEQFKQLLISTEELTETKRAAQLREYLFNKAANNEPTDAKIVLDGLVAFYSSTRGNLLKMQDFFDSHACCYGALMLIPGNKTACDYIVKPERVDQVLGGHSWHGQPHLRSDHSRVGLCPNCLESLLKMRIDSYKAFISKIRNTLANNKNSPYAKAAEEKEKKLTEELNYLQIDIERVIATKLTFGRIEEPEETKTHQVQQDDVTDDADLEFLLQQEFAFDSPDNQDHSFFDREESSNSEQSKSIEEVKCTPAAKKRILVNLELEGDDTPLRSRKLKHDDHKELATAPNTRSRTANKGAQANRNTVNNTNVMTVKQTKGQKRKRQEEVFITSKKRKLQPAGGKKEVPNNSTSEEMNSLALRVEDTTCLFPLTISQVFLFNALAVTFS